jgi:hypothetical protein
VSNLDALFPPPYVVQRRAWECGYALLTDYLPRLNGVQRQIAGWIAARRPERLGWEDAREAFRIWGQVVEVRR